MRQKCFLFGLYMRLLRFLQTQFKKHGLGDPSVRFHMSMTSTEYRYVQYFEVLGFFRFTSFKKS